MEYKVIVNDEKGIDHIINNSIDLVEDEIEKIRQVMLIRSLIILVYMVTTIFLSLIFFEIALNYSVYYLLGIPAIIWVTLLIYALHRKSIHKFKCCLNCHVKCILDRNGNIVGNGKKLPPLDNINGGTIDVDTYNKRSFCCESFKKFKSDALVRYLEKERNIRVYDHNISGNMNSILCCSIYALIYNVKHFTGHFRLETNEFPCATYIVESPTTEEFVLRMPENSGILGVINNDNDARTRYFSCHGMNLSTIVNNLDFIVVHLGNRVKRLIKNLGFQRVIIDINRGRSMDIDSLSYIDRALKFLESHEFATICENFDLGYINLHFKRDVPAGNTRKILMIGENDTMDSIRDKIVNLFPK